MPTTISLLSCITKAFLHVKNKKECNRNRKRDSRGHQTSRDNRTRKAIARGKGTPQENGSDRPSKERLGTIREPVRYCKRSILQGQWCPKGIKERWTTLSVLPSLYFSQLVPVLSAITIDDYIMYNKVQLVIECWTSHSIQVCARGIGM